MTLFYHIMVRGSRHVRPARRAPTLPPHPWNQLKVQQCLQARKQLKKQLKKLKKSKEQLEKAYRKEADAVEALKEKLLETKIVDVASKEHIAMLRGLRYLGKIRIAAVVVNPEDVAALKEYGSKAGWKRWTNRIGKLEVFVQMDEF